MSKDWIEAWEKIVEFQDDDPNIFDLYFQLVYTDHLPH